MIATTQNNTHGTMGLGRWSACINEGFWKPRKFDMLIIELLQYAIQGKVSGILLGVPSRHGKSTLISKNFCSYFLSHFPNEQVILSSYSQGLASEFGGQVKDIVNYYGHLSPYKPTIRSDSKAKNKFKLNKPYHGQMLSAGAGGSIMGYGAGLLIVDDPIKNVAEVDSKIRQAKLREWWGGTIKSRVQRRSDRKPPIKIVIAQRLHLNDLHGIIKETEPTISANEAFAILRSGGTIDQSVWVDLNIPAICDSEDDVLGRKIGQVLWEEQRDYDWLMAEKRSMGSYLFNAIYQGQPIERDGEIFKREWFQDEVNHKLTCLIDPKKIPKDLPQLRYWDFGASGDAGDGTSAILTSWDGEYLYLLDLVAGKYSSLKVLRTFKRLCKKDGKGTRVMVEQEPGSGSKLLIKKFRREDDLKGYNIRADKVQVSKKVRAFDLEGIAEYRWLKMVPAPWNDKLINQLVAFTGEDGGEDDIVDTITGSCRFWTRPRRKVKA